MSLDSALLTRIVECYQFLIVVDDAFRLLLPDSANDTGEQAQVKTALRQDFHRVRRKFSTYRWTVLPWTDATVEELNSDLTSVFRSLVQFNFMNR